MAHDLDLSPVFLVDDDPDAELLVEHILRKSGVSNPLRFWNSSAEALADWAILEASGPDSATLPLFFLIDLKMPEVSGFKLLSWLREQPLLGTRPRIVITSSMDPRDASVAHDMGASGFLTKYPTPFVLAAIARFAMQQGASASELEEALHAVS